MAVLRRADSRNQMIRLRRAAPAYITAATRTVARTSGGATGTAASDLEATRRQTLLEILHAELVAFIHQ